MEDVYDGHATAIRAFLLSLLRDDDLAREVMPNLFCKIAGRPKLLDGVRNERSFLLRLAHNQAIDLLRRHSAVVRKKEALAESAPSPFAPVTDPDEQARSFTFPGPKSHNLRAKTFCWR